jgi:hypothetical protein
MWLRLAGGEPASLSCPLGLCHDGLCADPGFCAGAREADTLEAANRFIPGAPPPRRAAPATPQSTIEAIVWSVRARGVGALKEPATMARLGRCDERAVKEINARISKLTGGRHD